MLSINTDVCTLTEKLQSSNICFLKKSGQNKIQPGTGHEGPEGE
jgi:hypothetical protein